MKRIDCYLDVVSPYAYLAFERLPAALQGLSYDVNYRPILFAGLLKHHGQLGPAEIGPKRDWTYRQVLWLAHTHGVPLELPQAHPFNPLALLRLAWAAAAQGTPSRWVCETLLRHVWRGGLAADDAERLAALTQALAPPHDPAGDSVKQRLREATDAAIDAGVFGVPSFVVDGRVFWGLDALPMLRAHLEGEARLDAVWAAAERVAGGAPRRVTPA